MPAVVIGAGQAGLSMSRLLTIAGRRHLVLERRTSLGGGWQDRWDNFHVVTPNWLTSLPGQPYDGADPDGFMERNEIAARVARYAHKIEAPVMTGTSVKRLSSDGGGFPAGDQLRHDPRRRGCRGDWQLPHAAHPPATRRSSRLASFSCIQTPIATRPCCRPVPS